MTETTAVKGRPRKYTREALITNLQELATENGRTPGAKELNAKDGRPSLQAYITAFTTLNAAQEAAGLSARRRGRPAKAVAADEAIHDAHAETVAVFTTVTEAALHALAAGPMTATEVATKISDMVKINSKNPRKSVQEALHRSSKAVQVDGVFALV